MSVSHGKGSRNREKARLANTWKNARHQRDDYFQKITTSFAKGFGKIVFERLSIDKNHNLLVTLGTIDTGFYLVQDKATDCL
ncbi:MAG: hypothetical protein WBZ36_03950 [Candidatus Nitrosopolaris sp.]